MRSRKSIIFTIVLALALVAGFFAPGCAKRWAQSMTCGNNMCSICFAARTWAMDSEGKLPADFLTMSNELSTPKVLICDADHSRQAATNWASFTPNLSSYEIVGFGLQEGDPKGVYLRCKIHKDHIGYADATVFDGFRRRTKFP
jgi:hypothetical protein